MNIYKNIYDGNAIAILDPKRMSFMNSLIPSLARVSLAHATLVKHINFSLKNK